MAVDNNRHSHRYYGGNGNEQNATLLYTALIAFITAGVCFFIILLCGANDYYWDEENDGNHHNNNNPNHPSRPTRQRLTKEQVRQLFPIYRYDGQSKLYRILPVPSPAVVHATDTSASDSLQQPLLAAASNHHTDTRPPQEVIDNMVLDVCSICLDEYETHDKIRILPCHHTFHSKCVGRWLSERSAVCPLCKGNLYIEPASEPTVEADTESNGATATDTNHNTTATETTTSTTTEESTLLVSFNNAWRRFVEQVTSPPTAVATNRTTTTTRSNTTATTTTTATDLLNVNTITDVEMPIVTPTGESTTTTEDPDAVSAAATTATASSRISSSWWSRMFPQTTSSTSSSSPSTTRNDNNSLTEPLLPPPNQEQQGDIETAGGGIESPVPTTSSTPSSLASAIEDTTANDTVVSVVVPVEDAVTSSNGESRPAPTMISHHNTDVDDGTRISVSTNDHENHLEKSDTETTIHNNDETMAIDMTAVTDAPDPLLTL